jgi:hypothetical protein
MGTVKGTTNTPQNTTVPLNTNTSTSPTGVPKFTLTDPNSQYMDKQTNQTYLTQTSQPDITSLVNGVMQQMVGRNATPEEIQRYGSELLAAERANTGSYAGTTQQTDTGRIISGLQTTTGVDPAGFLQTLISGTADAQSYKAATGYFQAMLQSTNQFKGALNG